MTVKRRAQRRAGASLKAKARALALGVLALGVGAHEEADAHPEFSALGTNRYVTAAVFDGRVDVVDALLEGTLVSGGERRRLDADGDGRISDGELRAGEARLRAEGAAVTVEVDGRALAAPLDVAIDLGDEPRANAAPVVIERRLSFPGAFGAGARWLRLVVIREPPRVLDTELGLVLGPGFALAGGEDRVTFRGARASALEERAATFEIAGPPPPPARSRASRRLPAGLGVVAVILAGLAAARRRARRSARR
jgi:hypothetical protein